MSIEEVAQAIQSVKGYKSGMSVRIISCEGAAHAKDLSQALGGAKVISVTGGAGGVYPYPFPLSNNPFE